MALKDYFRKFEEVLEGFDEKDPWPTKEDLEPGKIYMDQKSYLEIQSFLRDYRYCLVEGAERRGKTTLVRCIGFSYIEDWYVAQLDVSRVSDINDIAPFITQLEKSQDLPKTLIIVEDCHIRPEVTKVLLRAAERCREASFLFTMRTVKQGKGIRVEDPFEGSVIREQDWVVQIDEDNETIYNNIKGIVEKYKEIDSGELEYKSPQAIPSSDDYRYLVEQTGGNKRILKYYVDAWISSKSPTLSLQRVGRALIIEQFHKERLQGLSDVQIEVLLTMSALGQFEVPIFIRPLFPSAVSKLDFDRAADEVSTLKGLAFRLPQGAWLLADTESRLTLECMEYLKRIDGSFVYSVLRMYVKEAANYFEVFHALHRAQERALLISLIEDAEVHNSLVRRFGEPKIILSEMLYVLRAIGWADKVKALALWRGYRETFGERFFDEVQHKLLEAYDIRITTTLLNFLRTIDKEGEAVPLAKALTVEFLLSQARAELAGFIIVNNMVQQLHTLAPERAKQVLNGLNASDYEKLGEIARQKNSQQIMWFLRLLNYTESEVAAEAFLNGLGLEALSEMVRSSTFSVTLGIIKRLETIVPGKVQQVINGLSESHFRKFGEEAKHSSLQVVMWFLRWLAADEKLKKFADQFLNAIGKDTLIKMAQMSPLRTIRNFRNTLSTLSTDTATELRNNINLTISDDEWIERWTKETVGRQSRRLWGWACSLNIESRERGKKLVKRLADVDRALQFGKVELAEPVDKLAWLLFGAYYLDEEAAKDLALKVAKAFDLQSMTYSVEHLVYLLKNSRWCNPDASQQLVEKIFSSDAPHLLSKGELDWFCQLLWEAALSNKSRTKEWVTEVSEGFWEDLAVSASTSDAFRLLLALWQANEGEGRKITRAVGNQLLMSPKLTAEPEAIPLLGFFAFCGLEPQVALSFSPAENIAKLYIHPASQRLACSLFYLQRSKPEAIPGFIKAMLTIKGVMPRIALLLAEHPLPWTALALADILVAAESESRKEREDIYDRMVLLYRTIRRRAIYLNTLLNEMCAPQFARRSEPTLETEVGIEREEEKIRSWATIRLSNAIDKGIFTVQKTEHPITHRASRLLNLNRDHPQVTFALDITRDLLLALHDAQKGNEWADGDAWDIALLAEHWKGEPLPPLQLRYWKIILLKMNAIKVDYRKTDECGWIVAFRVDSDHPLVKPLIA